MTFLAELWIVLPLSAALVLHTVSALVDLIIKNEKTAKILNTGLTCLNILLHLVLICVMMERKLTLEEAVFVYLISIFFHTLLYFIRYTVSISKAKRRAGEEGNNA